MSTDRKRDKNFSQNMQTNDKMKSLIDDFNNLAKTFGKTKSPSKKRKKKQKVRIIPSLIKQSTNISEDSDDPKRRTNVIGVTNTQQILSQINFKNPLGILGNSINEEPFQSEEVTSSSGSESEEKTKKKDVDQKIDMELKKTNTNFFVHRKVKNTRQSILADRPLTIFKANTNKDGSVRFFSPPPMVPKKLVRVDSETNISKKSIPTVPVKPLNAKIKLKKRIQKSNMLFKKVNVRKVKNDGARKYLLKNKMKIGMASNR